MQTNDVPRPRGKARVFHAPLIFEAAPVAANVTAVTPIVEQSPAPQPPPKPKPRKPKAIERVVAAEEPPVVAEAPPEAAVAPPRTPEPALVAAAPVPVQAEAPVYLYARRSSIFGGFRSAREATTNAPSAAASAMPPVLADALARSVWSVVNEVLGAGDGTCRVLAPVAADLPARFECSEPGLTDALANVAEDKLRSLGSWLRGGYVAAIDLAFEGGRASFTTQGR
ncbi:MAG TPA: hypothetical protein VFR86_04400 [Burkholderiaceae bacterium]|nr:hypothetical protein [Burkholderiaceae bacterium]